MSLSTPLDAFLRPAHRYKSSPAPEALAIAELRAIAVCGRASLGWSVVIQRK